MSDLTHLRHRPTVAEVEQIIALPDPVIGNLQITQCYHELAAMLAERTGVSANWCTFATWASKQAGQTMRKEDLGRTLERILHPASATPQAAERVAASAQQLGAPHDREKIQAAVWQVLNPAAAIDRASDAVGRGNQKVFAEIGREFARFCATCLHDVIFDADNIRQFCEALRPGDPPAGQRYLRQAFRRYYEAFFTNDIKTRAELLLLANIEIGFHEQTRLQPEIAAALDAALVDAQQFRSRLLTAILPYHGWPVWTRLCFTRWFGRPTPFDTAVDTFIAAVRRQLRLLITEHLMTIALPRGVRLRLGADLRAAFPPSLQQIVNADLLAMLAQIDPTPNSTHDSGAVDWADLPERLHFIADMFRCYQEARHLFDAPFTPEQVVALKAGHLPPGRL